MSSPTFQRGICAYFELDLDRMKGATFEKILLFVPPKNVLKGLVPDWNGKEMRVLLRFVEVMEIVLNRSQMNSAPRYICF